MHRSYDSRFQRSRRCCCRFDRNRKNMHTTHKPNRRHRDGISDMQYVFWLHPQMINFHPSPVSAQQLAVCYVPRRGVADDAASN